MWHVEMYKVVDGAMWDFGIHSCNYNTRIYGTEVSPFEKGKLSPQTIQGSPKSVFGDPVSIQGFNTGITIAKFWKSGWAKSPPK